MLSDLIVLGDDFISYARLDGVLILGKIIADAKVGSGK